MSQSESRRRTGTFTSFVQGVKSSLFRREQQLRNSMLSAPSMQRPAAAMSTPQQRNIAATAMQDIRIRCSTLLRRRDLASPRSAYAGAWNSSHESFRRLKFFVVTNASDPGFTLTQAAVLRDGQQQIAVLAITTLYAWNAGLRPGDILETVSGTSVRSKTVEQAMASVTTAAPHAVLRFSVAKRVAALCAVERVDVMLGPHELGITLTGDGSELIPVVHRLGRERHHRDPAARLLGRLTNAAAIRRGDVLTAVNDVDTVALGFDKTTALLAQMRDQSLTLTFQRLSNELRETDSSLRSTTLLASAAISATIRTERQHRSSWSSSTALAVPRTHALQQQQATRSARTQRHSAVTGNRQQLAMNRRMAANAVHATTNTLDERNDVQDDKIVIVWHDGPLGLTLVEDALSGLPCVNRRTGKGRSFGLDRLQHGDLLTSVNGKTTERQTFAAIYKLLVCVDKPVLLCFESPMRLGVDDVETLPFAANSSSSSLLSNDSNVLCGLLQSKCAPALTESQRMPATSAALEYDVVWSAGEKLGLVLGSANTTQDSNAGGAARAAASTAVIRTVQSDGALRIEQSAVGDVLVAINNNCTLGLAWRQVCRLLDRIDRPAVLRFRRRQHECVDANSNNKCLELRRTASLSSVASLSANSLDMYRADDDSDINIDSEGSSSSDSECGTSTRMLDRNYSILWRDGRLGIAFSTIEDDDCALGIVVLRLVRHGYARRTHLVSVGDRLVRLNCERVELQTHADFRETMRRLEAMCKPVVLGFERPIAKVSKP